MTLGKVQKKMSLYDLKLEQYASLYKPVFVLSTGRCRTHWLTNVLSEQRNLRVEHDPEINFLEEGRLFYEYFNRNENHRLLEQLVCTARDHIWLDCAKRNLRYIETNNRISFAVPVLQNLIPDSVFLHLTRHPIDFIRSGRNRDWYQGGSHDLGRIVMGEQEIWESLNLNQKIGWLWIETNRFIMEHTQHLPEDRIMRVASEDLNFDKMKEVIAFLGLDVDRVSNSWFGKATNIQQDHLNISNEEIKADLKTSFFYKEIKELAEVFGYDL